MKKLFNVLFGLILSASAVFAQTNCGKISRSVDPMEGTVKLSTPGGGLMNIYKFIEDGRTTTYLALTANGYSLSVGGTGATILLSDGTKIERPNQKIDCDPGYGSLWTYSTWIRLTDEEVERLSNNTISMFRLYAYDSSPRGKYPEKIRIWMGCISTMN